MSGFCKICKLTHEGNKCPICGRHKNTIPIIMISIIGIVVLVGVFGYSNYSSEFESFVDNTKNKIQGFTKETTEIQNINEEHETTKEWKNLMKKEYLYSNSDVFKKINEVRLENNVSELMFDDRVYNIAISRLEDMEKYDYYAHTNSKTGICADKIKKEFGLNDDEYVAENLMQSITRDSYGNVISSFETVRDLKTEAVSGWMHSSGHKTNLLWTNHISGAVACDDTVCIFLGLNYDGYGKGCY